MDANATVFVVDDDAAARESVMAVVSAKGVPAKGFASAEEFLAHFDANLRGCLVVDVRMSGMSGLQLLQQLAGSRQHAAGHRHHGLCRRADGGEGDASRGAHLPRKAVPGSGAVAGDSAGPRPRSVAASICGEQTGEIQTRLTTLTEDEVAVLRKLLEGLPNKRIAVDLDIGLRTVELRRSNIMKKMEAASLPELVRMAILIGFLKAES